MKFTISTTLFQELMAKALKGASFNKLLPLTSLVSIKCENGKIVFCTTDGSNYLYVDHDFENEDFEVVVQADILSKLVSKLTCENTTVEKENGILNITGNGKYSIELPLDENGHEIKYPNPLAECSDETELEIPIIAIQDILNVAKPALAVTMETPCYTGFYCGDKVISTDSYMICALDSKLFNDSKLISPVTMELLNLMTSDKIKVYPQNDNVLVFKSDDCVVYGHTMEGIEDYAVDAINGLLDTSMPHTCKVSKTKMLEILDRLVIFVDAYDNNSIYLTFNKNGITITSKKSSGIETVPYLVDNDNEDEFTCSIDVTMLQSQIKAYADDAVVIEYGNEQAIKLIGKGSKQLIALLEE